MLVEKHVSAEDVFYSWKGLLSLTIEMLSVSLTKVCLFLLSLSDRPHMWPYIVPAHCLNSWFSFVYESPITDKYGHIVHMASKYGSSLDACSEISMSSLLQSSGVCQVTPAHPASKLGERSNGSLYQLSLLLLDE